MPRVPDRTIYDPVLDVHMHTGANAVEMGRRFTDGPLATDIETPGLDRQFTINCVTLCWEEQGRTHAILLDPRRTDGHAALIHRMYDRASKIVLHNAPFDVPGLHLAGLLDLAHIDKITDTVVLARFAFPSPMVSKSLSALAGAHLGMNDYADGMKLAFKAAGYRTIAAGYEGMDIDSPIYRQGAMLDTVATLRLEPVLRRKAWEWTIDHPFEKFGATTVTEADGLLGRQEQVHRIMLRQTALGVQVHLDYLDEYTASVVVDRRRAEALLAQHGLEGGMGRGAKLIEYLDEIGELPQPWPRTPKGKLRATKDDLEALEHPLATAQRTLAEMDKVEGYLRKVLAQAEFTGRCHPQVGTLAASATGRMSYAAPELQQFNRHARKVLGSDNPEAADNHRVENEGTDDEKHLCIGDGQQMWSIDWSQIEPVTMGTMAGDEKFLAPYEAGQDLYAPLMRAAGIDRPTAKIVLLADMYGQGEAGMARRIDKSIEQAGQIRRQIRAAMPDCTRWMAKVQAIANDYGRVVTAGGRILPVDEGGVFRAVNYIVQGSAYDVLANAILTIDNAGLGHTLRLAMHDELVLDATREEAEEVQRIMGAPPPFFRDWLGRDPVLRTDRAPMGASWRKV